MSQKLKSIVVFLKIIVSFVLTRPFAKVIHDLTQNYNGSLAVSDIHYCPENVHSLNAVTLTSGRIPCLMISLATLGVQFT